MQYRLAVTEVSEKRAASHVQQTVSRRGPQSYFFTKNMQQSTNYTKTKDLPQNSMRLTTDMKQVNNENPKMLGSLRYSHVLRKTFRIRGYAVGDG